MQRNQASVAGFGAAEDSVAGRYFGATDAVFVIIAIMVSVMVVWFGAKTFTEGMHTEQTKTSGERIAAWIEEAGTKREAGEPTGIAACDEPDANWAGCRDALVAQDGPLAGVENVTRPAGPRFASGCERSQLDTLGAFIIEKGLPKPPDGAALAYNAIADDEVLNQPLALRVAVCGRGFSRINIREVRF